MRVRVTNRKALLARFAGRPGETGVHETAKGWRAVFHMCGGCARRFESFLSRHGFAVQQVSYGVETVPERLGNEKLPTWVF